MIAIDLALYSTRDPSDGATSGQRRFLTSSAAGFGALIAGVIGSLGHALFGVGKKGGGWHEINGQISDAESVHPVAG